jgi:curved DNA-binding protein CbpA
LIDINMITKCLKSRILMTNTRAFATALPARTEKDFYTILGVPTHATSEQVKDAYRALAKKHHPDVRSQDGEHDPDVEKFRNVVEAYQVLSVKESRAAFDLTRKKNPHMFSTPMSDEQYDMNYRRDLRNKHGMTPRSKPARGSYAEQRIAELRKEREKYNVNDLGYYNGGVPRENRGSVRGDSMGEPGSFHSP